MRLNVDGQVVYAYTGARAFDAARPSIVFVHGAANDHSVWALQSRYFAHHGFNVFAIDRPGYGRSTGEPMPTIDATAAWLCALLDAIGLEAAALVGHSYGALATLAGAARCPGRITRLALLGPAVPMAVAEALLDAARANDHVAYEFITGWSFSAGKQLGGNRNPGLWMTGNAMRLMERTRPGVLHTDLLACHEYAGGTQAAARVGCPTLLILAARDQMTPVATAQPLIDGIADVRVVTLPDCGHSMMAEQPDRVLDALAAFL